MGEAFQAGILTLECAAFSGGEEGFFKKGPGLAGWKGYRRGEVGVHAKQALVLVNYGKGTGAEVHQLAQDIREDVRQKFNITLDFEVNIW